MLEEELERRLPAAQGRPWQSRGRVRSKGQQWSHYRLTKAPTSPCTAQGGDGGVRMEGVTFSLSSSAAVCASVRIFFFFFLLIIHLDFNGQ